MPIKEADWTFDEAYWVDAIKKPDWYLEFVPYMEQAAKVLKDDQEKLDKLAKDSRHFFEQALLDDKIKLAKTGPDFDAERLPVDTVVIHHTSHTPGYRLNYLNAVHLLNIYAPYFVNPTVRSDQDEKGQPLWSGHFKDKKQVFWGYHWLVRMDGTFERLLEDNQIGWHAGDWEINRRSIGICIDNDYENMCPTDLLLKNLASHIKQNYPEISPEKIIGHCEVREGTVCPGSHFMDEWKPKLVEYMK